MKTKSFSFRKRADSFRFAWEGIRRFFAEEHNTWIHLAVTVTVFFGAGWFRLSRMEIILLVIAAGFVWVAEIFNTAIEKIMDIISPQLHPEIKYIKDLSAAAVLIASFIAMITGVFIFIPKFF
jgi:diacylglycerol kinase